MVGDNIPHSKVLTSGVFRILLVTPSDSVRLGNVEDAIDTKDAVNLGQVKKLIEEIPTGGLTLVPGDGIEIDDTDPENPIISVDLQYVIDNTAQYQPGNGINFDSTDPLFPLIELDLNPYISSDLITLISGDISGEYSFIQLYNNYFSLETINAAADGASFGGNFSSIHMTHRFSGVDQAITIDQNRILIDSKSTRFIDSNNYYVDLSIGASDGSFGPTYATFSLGTNNNQSTYKAVYLIGDNLTATGDYGFSVGSINTVGYVAMALGYNSTASGNFSLTLGNEDIASGLKSVAIGNDLLSSGESSLTLGNNLSATGLKSIVIGSGLGASALVNSTPNSVGIGSGVLTPTILVTSVLNIPGLGGSGLRMLTVSNTGEVSAQAIPGGGGGGTDVTLAAFGSSPAAEGASINGAGQILTLQPADLTHPGGISLSAQVMGAGNKTFTDDIIMGSTKSLRNAAGTQFLSIDAGGFINLQGSANTVVRGGGTVSQLTLSTSGATIGAPAVTIASSSTGVNVTAASGQTILFGTTGSSGETTGDIVFSNLRPVYLKSIGSLAPNAANQKGSSTLHFESNLFSGVTGQLKTFTISAVASTSVNNLTNLVTRYDGTNLHLTSQTGDFEILASGAGIILTDTVAGTRHRVVLTSGVLTISAAL